MFPLWNTKCSFTFKSARTPILCLEKNIGNFVSRKPQYKDVYRRTMEVPQCAHTFQVNCCLKVHNAHPKLLSPISGYVFIFEKKKKTEAATKTNKIFHMWNIMWNNFSQIFAQQTKSHYRLCILFAKYSTIVLNLTWIQNIYKELDSSKYYSEYMNYWYCNCKIILSLGNIRFHYKKFWFLIIVDRSSGCARFLYWDQP